MEIYKGECKSCICKKCDVGTDEAEGDIDCGITKSPYCPGWYKTSCDGYKDCPASKQDKELGILLENK